MNAYLHDMNDDLLVKYLLGEASAGERAAVEQWVAEDIGNRRYFDHFRLIWEESKKLAATSTADENQAWQRFQQRVGVHSSDQQAVVRTMHKKRNGWLRSAAVFVLLAGVASLIYLVWHLSGTGGTTTQVTVAAANVPKVDTLPDGSIITLNKKSSLTYPSAFKGTERPVQLKGEAFFRIKPDKNKPFVVHINDLTITVLGTSFNVKSVDGKTEVIVETGRVEVTRAQEIVQLKPREKIVVSQHDSAFTKEAVTDQLYKYYRTKEFVCENTPLWKLAEVLNEAYDVNIVIERKELRSLLIDAPFYDESIDKILEVIVETFPEYKIQVSRKDKIIILK